MHIEPGLLTGAKMALSYGTGIIALGAAVKAAADALRAASAAVPLNLSGRLLRLFIRSVSAFAVAFAAFEILPHPPVGVSEVHLILGSTLFLLFGLAPAAIGLALALLVQGLFFAPSDLPQYFANVTTLLAPLFAVAAVAKRTIAPDTPYTELRYRDVFRLSLTFQGGVVLWVAFWAFLGLGAEAGAEIATFGAAYLAVLVIEPALDLALLAAAKQARAWIGDDTLFTARLTRAA
jgi:hypothetical protein